jgi:hypothetical protein
VLLAGSRRTNVSVTVTDRQLVAVMRGADALLCARRVVSVPVSAIRMIDVVRRDELPPSGMRFPGTSLPGFIRAGSFGFREERSFWNVRRADLLLRVELDPAQADYCRLILEVDNPSAVAAQLRSELATCQAVASL